MLQTDGKEIDTGNFSHTVVGRQQIMSVTRRRELLLYGQKKIWNASIVLPVCPFKFASVSVCVCMRVRNKKKVIIATHARAISISFL